MWRIGFRFAEACGLIGSGSIVLCGSRCSSSRYIEGVIRTLRDDERAWANTVYRSIKFAETPPGTFAVTYEGDGELIGLGRLVELEAGVIEMGGIWTAEAARGRGIARAIVMALIEHAGNTRLWCIPFTHLQAFYESCGFVVKPEPWPATVAAKIGDCIAKQLPPAIVLTRG